MVTSSGLAMEIHYCMGKRAGVEFFHQKQDKCSKCGMKEKKGCCNDEHKFYKLEGAYKNATNNISFSATDQFASLPLQPVSCLQIIESPVLNNTKNHSPPQDTGPALSVLYCIFRL
jgi:hypothetical protein